LEKDGTTGRFHLDFGLKRKKIWISWTWIQLGFSKDPDLFKKPLSFSWSPVWMNPSGWLVSGFLRIGLVFLGLWISYVFGFLGFLTGTD
jgi:hypothetical protein